MDSAARAAQCPSCAQWNTPHAPVHVFGNVYVVGTDGLTAVLITSAAGHVLIDGGLAESAPRILANVRALGFRIEDVKIILNSHAHFDHAGGIAALQRASGARVAATAPSATVLERGASGPDDPQFPLLPFPAVAGVAVVDDGDTIRIGDVALVPHVTAGHTRGGTTWSWRSCDATGRCLSFVYADSQSPISAPGFRFSSNTTYASVLEDFAHGLGVIESLPCDVLLTPHPSASRMWERMGTSALVNADACREFAAAARQTIAQRVARERAAQ